MLVRMQLSLPRDARYVAMMRNVCDCVLSDFGVPPEAGEDIKLAVTEACANVVKHAADSSDYSVRMALGSDGCTVEIVDLGSRFAHGDLVVAANDHGSQTRAGLEGADESDYESGRGLFLMRALVDDLQFLREDDATRVRLIKRWPGAARAGANGGDDGAASVPTLSAVEPG